MRMEHSRPLGGDKPGVRKISTFAQPWKNETISNVSKKSHYAYALSWHGLSQSPRSVACTGQKDRKTPSFPH